MTGEKTINFKQPIEKRLRVSAPEINDNTKDLEKVVSSVCRIKTKVWATVASGAINLKNYKEWLDSIESDLRSIRFTDVAVVLTPVLDIAVKVTIPRWGFKVKSDRRFTARWIVLGWR